VTQRLSAGAAIAEIGERIVAARQTGTKKPPSLVVFPAANSS